MTLDAAVESHHATEHPWGDMSPLPHGALGTQVEADRFVIAMAFHGALLPSPLAYSATSRSSFPVLWAAAV